VNRILQIGCIAIASYLLALPILFVVHDFTHHHSTEHHCFDTTNSENEVYDDCNICDLFQNQQLFHQENPQLFKVELIVEEWITEEVRDYNFCLIDVSARGPPIG